MPNSPFYGQYAHVCLPVEVLARAVPGCVRTYCCGPAELIPCATGPTDAAKGCCRYVLRQHMVTEIPLEMGARAMAGEPFVKCVEECFKE